MSNPIGKALNFLLVLFLFKIFSFAYFKYCIVIRHSLNTIGGTLKKAFQSFLYKSNEISFSDTKMDLKTQFNLILSIYSTKRKKINNIRN